MKVLFVAGFGPAIIDVDQSRGLYVTTLKLPLKEDADHYFHSESIEGVKHFALGPCHMRQSRILALISGQVICRFLRP